MAPHWTDAPLSCLIADRAYDGDAFRAWLAQRGLEVVIPALTRCNPQSHKSYNLEWYQARHIVYAVLGGSNAGSAYQYAHHRLGSLYWQ